MPQSRQNSLPLVMEHFRPGMRVGIGVSGGADSVALLCSLAAKRQECGLVLTVLHVHHGIRGAAADADAEFVAALAARLELRFLRHNVDTPARARSEQETVEEAARNLRYAWFEKLLAQRELDVVATAHTLDDQAETVLYKLLRGAWTEGLAGIFPIVERSGGTIVRPLLRTRRAEIEAWLRERGQSWQEDATNQDVSYTRNRIRHQLLPVLAEYNPRVAAQLAQLAAIARDEDAYWQAELARLLPSLLLPGKAVRGGGRSSSTHPDEKALAIEVERLRLLHPALRRRVLRAAVAQLGGSASFDQTELLLAMCEARAGRRETLTGQLRAERTPRELRLIRGELLPSADGLPEYEVPVPGEITAEAFRLRLTLTAAAEKASAARLRIHRPGDRVRLRYSQGPKRIKEVLERMQVPAGRRKQWPVLEWQGEIVWMPGVELESPVAAAAGLIVHAVDTEKTSDPES